MPIDKNNKSRNDFNEMSVQDKIMWRSSQLNVPANISKEDAYMQLKQKIASSKPLNVKPVRLMKPWFYIAASITVLALISGAWLFFTRAGKENIIVSRGEQTDYNLPDGSKVSLNADSRLTFSKRTFDNKRKVTFEGEAFFSIQKGSTFTIATSYADIKILGTSFNVFAREEDFSVTCCTGKIIVSSGNQSEILLPKDRITFGNGQFIVKHNEDVNKITSWRFGEFIFENSPLNSIFDEIERQYNVIFVRPDLDDLFFTGSFSNKNLVEALDIVCIPMGLTYEIGSNSKIFIKIKSE